MIPFEIAQQMGAGSFQNIDWNQANQSLAQVLNAKAAGDPTALLNRTGYRINNISAIPQTTGINASTGVSNATERQNLIDQANGQNYVDVAPSHVGPTKGAAYQNQEFSSAGQAALTDNSLLNRLLNPTTPGQVGEDYGSMFKDSGVHSELQDVLSARQSAEQQAMSALTGAGLSPEQAQQALSETKFNSQFGQNLQTNAQNVANEAALQSAEGNGLGHGWKGFLTGLGDLASFVANPALGAATIAGQGVAKNMANAKLQKLLAPNANVNPNDPDTNLSQFMSGMPYLPQSGGY